jgi:hypothetical protein
MNDVLLDKLNNISRCHQFHRNSFYPFGEVICDSQNELMTFARWRINFANHIHAPASERPWFNNGVHHGCWYHLDLPEPLTCLTPFIILKTILKHGGPIVP